MGNIFYEATLPPIDPPSVTFYYESTGHLTQVFIGQPTTIHPIGFLLFFLAPFYPVFFKLLLLSLQAATGLFRNRHFNQPPFMSGMQIIFSLWLHSIFVLSLSVYPELSASKDLVLIKAGESFS